MILHFAIPTNAACMGIGQPEYKRVSCQREVHYGSSLPLFPCPNDAVTSVCYTVLSCVATT